MRTLIAFIPLFLLLNTRLFAQDNLIPNPSFEDSVPCVNPTNNALYHYYRHWSSCYEDRYQPNCESQSLVYPWGFYGQPDTARPPRTGRGQSWLLTYNNATNVDNISTWWTDKRYYLMTPLTKPLETGKYYYFEMYVRRVPQLFTPPTIGKSASNGLGLNVSDTNLVYNSWKGREGQQLVVGPISGGKTVVSTNTIITSDSTWTKINGCFTATSNAKYATIGNFRTISATALLEMTPSPDKRVNAKWADYDVDDVKLIEIPKANPLRDTALCEGDTLRLNIYNKLAIGYLWDDKTKTPQYNITKSGRYGAQTYFSNIPSSCDIKEYINVSFSPRSALTRTFDTVTCLDNKTVKLTAGVGIAGEKITWPDSSNLTTLTVNKTGTYVADITNKCGTFRDSFTVKFEKCEATVFVPNSFSPNGDGANDTFTPFFNAKFTVKTYALTIFNRWGALVFKTNDPNTPWDGTFRGAVLAPDVFVWQLKVTGMAFDKPFEKQLSGDVSLVK
jgi:gliding motility-associated-like protein